MHKAFLGLIILFFLTSCSKPSNFAECIVQDMEGVQNIQVYSAIFKACKMEFPEAYKNIQQGSGRVLFSNVSREECVIKNAKNTTFQQAATVTTIACGCLYNEPDYKEQTCFEYICKGYTNCS